MNRHRFHPLTQTCIGCDLRASEIADPPRAPREHQRTANDRVAECPAVYTAVEDKWAVITADERLIIFDRGTVQEFTQREMFGIRDAIDDGVRHLRKRDRKE